MKLTEKMKEILGDADLVRNEINDVPISAAYGLKDRELISSDWRKAKCVQTTGGGTFPIYHRAKLTKLGIETACLIKDQSR